MVPAIYLLIGMLFLPESPRWLAKQDRWEECQQTLARVHGKGDLTAPLVTLEFEEIKTVCEMERKFSSVSFLELFKPKMLNRTIIGAFDQIWCQLTGMNVMSTSSFCPVPLYPMANKGVVYYITYVFGMAGYKGNANLLASSITYVINVVSVSLEQRHGSDLASLLSSILLIMFRHKANKKCRG